MHDVFGNSVAMAQFRAPAAELLVESSVPRRTLSRCRSCVTMEEFARTYPFSYDADRSPISAAPPSGTIPTPITGSMPGRAASWKPRRARYDGDPGRR